MKKKGYKIFAAISVLIVFASIWYVHVNPHDYEECAKAAQIATYDDLMLEADVEPVTAARQAEYYQAIIDNQIKCSDLGAQWRTADIALLGYIAGLLGLVFLGITVFETQKASASASAALFSTREATNLVRQEQRPWLFIERKVSCDFSLSDEKVDVSWRYRMQNVGKSPAYNVCSTQIIVRTEFGFVSEADVTKAKTLLLERTKRGQGYTIIPNEPSRRFDVKSFIGTHLTTIEGKGDKFHLITGVAYKAKLSDEILFDIQVYRINDTGAIGPLSHKLIHNQNLRQVN